MLGPVTSVARASNLLGRNVMQNFVRNGSHGGVPGENLPFDIHSKTRLTLNLLLYGVTGFGAPFVILWHQLNKK